MSAVITNMPDTDRRHTARSWTFRVCLALSVALHGALLLVLGQGLRPAHVTPQARQAPMRVVLLPPEPKAPAVPPPPKKPANPLPPSPKPHIARQQVKTRTATPVRKVTPKPVLKQHRQVPIKRAPPLHLVAKPAEPRPSPHAPGKSSAVKMAQAPPRPLTTPLPSPISLPAPPQTDNSGGGETPDNGPGTGSQGAGTGSENGTGDGAGGDGGGGGGSAPYWPFGIDTGDAGGGGPRHVVYILDISASMESRIAQARHEIAAALDSLRSGETFDIVAFDERGQSFQSELVPASAPNIRDAKAYLNSLQLGPGTNLEAALKIALKISGANVVVLVTDGVPTVGEQSWRKLEKLARDLNRKEGARIFAIGLVGKNPDGTDDSFEATKLLQTLAADSGGKSTIYSLGVATPQ